METPTMPNSKPSAPYGHACTNCARAKSKCIISPNVGSKCERCHRLGKDCVPSAGVRKRNPVKTSSASRTAHLEEKLDGVLNLLKLSAQARSGLLSPRDSLVQAAQDEPDKIKSMFRDTAGSASQNALTPPLTQIPSGSASVAHLSPQLLSSYDVEPSPSEADECLNSFRMNFAPNFPFIIIPEYTTAQDLRRERPFLWLSIMTTCAKSVSKQRALETEFRIVLSRRILLEGERNMDLLMGLLVYVAWGQFFLFSKPILNCVVQIGISTLYDLGLTKPPPTEPTLLQRCNPQVSLNSFQPPARTMEERRVFVGFFLLNSCVAAGLQKIDPLRCSPYLEECLQMVTEDPAYPVGASWYYMVKLRILADKVSPASVNEGRVYNPSSHPPSVLYVKALQSQLDDLRSRIPSELQEYEPLLLHACSATVSINELALPNIGPNSPHRDVQWLEILWNCLKAAKKWFDTFSAMPTACLVYLPSPIYFQMGQVLIIAVRLLALEDRDWDRSMVNNELNLPSVLDQVIAKLSGTRAAAGLESNSDDIFLHHCHKMELFKSLWISQMSQKPSAPTEEQNIALDESMPDLSLNIADDAWLNDILGQWNIPSSSFL